MTVSNPSRSRADRNPRDPRAAALAAYLRQRASDFSLSADVNNAPETAEAGLALLDGALLAAEMRPDDPRLRALSEAGLFESMPDGEARFLETEAIRATIQRPIVGEPQSGEAILALLVAAASTP